MNVNKHLDKLEEQTVPPGPFVVCQMKEGSRYDLTEGERAAKLATAHTEAGPNGTVIVVEYGDRPLEAA